MSGNESCIVRHFKHYGPLSESDTKLLQALEKEPISGTSGQTLWEEGDKAGEICTIKSGWAYSYRNIDDGTRQVLDVFLPGDIVGLREFAFKERMSGIKLLTDSVICRFPHNHLIDIFRDSTKLTTIFFSISARQQTLLTERLVNLGRRNAFEKTAHLVYELYMRLKRTNPELGNSFELPLSQQIIADALGLSAVHVSRTFSELREENMICRERNHVTLLDIERLESVIGFSKAYLQEQDYLSYVS
ncbi:MULTISPECIES: Crp/Fnr family transcriptional regulator [Larsenimonas]|uniref:Crp/Fnr family transcriptional regulator n=1 Tax=Larsenimonas suaedae TaxID=1851019 RepID=A0ABU1GTL6_9GAMM|nr:MULTISPECIES: Crp/Fnr family transcriptional regulator [Larsenimonas]MCM2971818.1 Crp/Fnr family transcriptional regulator [Larsenimonas suaedae]MCM5703896.1 Crp/Fnr family transcriptional regulator [Larsenimonas salina]MDR5895370.1 Crp/Fnr family transcriptional regulator [Larsenimonas suaedae]